MKIETKEQADEAMAALQEFFGEPVRPVRQYCSALETWMRCLEIDAGMRPSQIPQGFTPRGKGGREGYVTMLGAIRRDITKSNLLARLIYGGQPLRTRPCPLHKGRWSGCHPEPCPHGCSDGTNITGWLPEEGTPEKPAPVPGGILFMAVE